MITTKQRAYLRSLSNTVDALYQTGKNGVTETVLQTLNDALEARELIKVTVLETNPESPKETMKLLTEKLGCEAVQVIGRKVVIYRASKNQPKIVLPKA